MRISKHDAKKFWSKVKRGQGCWLRIGNRGEVAKRYAGFKNHGAHRIAWQLTNGAIPSNRVIDHLCRRPACVNPSHMELVTIGENVLRGNAPPAQFARQISCKRGHALMAPNLLSASYGLGRRCRQCHTLYMAATKERRRQYNMKYRTRHRATLLLKSKQRYRANRQWWRNYYTKNKLLINAKRRLRYANGSLPPPRRAAADTKTLADGVGAGRAA